MTTDDLVTYNISNTNDATKISNTREGLQKLLDDKQSEGYNKLKLLEGTYRIDHIAPIYIPTKFTLDMNGATLKLHEFTGNSALMMELNNTFDSHVINGVVEGDYYNHDYANSPNNSEWVNGVFIGGESKYSSCENLIIKDITGYGALNGIKNSIDGKLRYTYLPPTYIGGTFKLGDIDRNTGIDIKSTNRTTCGFVDISGYSDLGYLSVSVYLGYQGNPCGTWNLIFHFYDENKSFIKSTDAYQYRRVAVPTNAKYMRVTILNESYPTNLSIQYFRVPIHCQFKNLKLDNCRCVGIAQGAMKDFLVSDCEFTKCGQSSAKCAYDAEDGWDMMQDVTLSRLNFHDNPNNEFLTCAGHNFILDNSICRVYIWPRTRGIIIKNTTLQGIGNIIGNDGYIRSCVPRFINNTVNTPLNFVNGSDYESTSIVRNCTFLSILGSAVAYNCVFDVEKGYMSNSTLNNCTVKKLSSYLENKLYFNNCLFENDNDIVYLRFNKPTGYIEFNKCTFKCSTSISGGKGIFNDCDFENLKIDVNMENKPEDLIFTNCNLSYTNNSLITLHSNSNLKFKNCHITEIVSSKTISLIFLYKPPTSGSCIFENCVINKNSGQVLDSYYNPNPNQQELSYEVILINSPVNIQTLSNKLQISEFKPYKVTIIN